MASCLPPSVPMVLQHQGMRGGMCHAIHWYALANNKYVNDYEPNKELSYLMYWDINNLYGLEMSQKFLWIFSD